MFENELDIVEGEMVKHLKPQTIPFNFFFSEKSWIKVNFEQLF